jgi:ribosomal protein S18 acetylase RimI-like enzyme
MLTDAELADLEHVNFIETIALVARMVADPYVARRDGVAVIGSGVPLRLFNQVMIEDASVTSDAIADGVAALRRRKDSFVVDLRSGTDDAFIPVVTGLGLVAPEPQPWIPGMAFHPLPSSAAESPDLRDHRIERVTNEAGLADHVHAMSAGFGMPEAMTSTFIRPALLRADGVTVYVGYRGDEPVTSGLGVRTGRSIGIYSIATVESARRRGYGAAMTARIIADGMADGCDVAVLQSSDMGYPIYERLGFRTVVRYVGYVDPASLGDEA